MNMRQPDLIPIFNDRVKNVFSKKPKQKMFCKIHSVNLFISRFVYNRVQQFNLKILILNLKHFLNNTNDKIIQHTRHICYFFVCLCVLLSWNKSIIFLHNSLWTSLCLFRCYEKKSLFVLWLSWVKSRNIDEINFLIFFFLFLCV